MEPMTLDSPKARSSWKSDQIADGCSNVSYFFHIFSPPVRWGFVRFYTLGIASSFFFSSSPRRPLRQLCSAVGSIGPQQGNSRAEWAAPDLNARKECQKKCQKECQKKCQKECQKKCQKECQKDMSEDMSRRYVRKNARKSVRGNVRNNVKKYVWKIARRSVWKNVRRNVRFRTQFCHRLNSANSRDQEERIILMNFPLPFVLAKFYWGSLKVKWSSPPFCPLPRFSLGEYSTRTYIKNMFNLFT